MPRAVVVSTLLISLAALSLSLWALKAVKGLGSADRVIVARGLIVQDASGRARVVLGAPAPDPVVRGKRGKRAAPISGLVLIGPDGNERGGYATTDSEAEALLTLDSSDGSSEVFKVVANPNAGASLFVSHQNESAVALTTYQGEPQLFLLDKTGVPLFSAPPNAKPPGN